MSAARSLTEVRPRPAQAGPGLSALLRQFPARVPAPVWAATQQSHDELLARLLAPPFVVEGRSNQAGRRAGLVKVLAWLCAQPGQTWQQRWQASGADAVGNVAWRQLAGQALRGPGWVGTLAHGEFIELGRGMLALLGGDVIRPSLAWLCSPGAVKHLVAEMARSRDPGMLARLVALCAGDPANAATKQAALRRICVVLAAKGGTVAQITVGDCLQLVEALTRGQGRSDTSLYFYQLLHAVDIFGPGAPPTVRIFAAPGQQR